jgi:hypothetical protein
VNIIRAAKDLDVDTKEWHITARFEFQAMAIEMPEVDGHPNRMPFTGILTRVDKPSDAAPHGGNGKRTVLPKYVAEAAIPSLLGMAVDCTKAFDGHDKKVKIGLITGAEVMGDAVHITGFFYAADFPEECARIRSEKDKLGFSYECQARIKDLEADQWVIEYCVFTGAAVLYKDKAAYTTTSLAAKAEKDLEMDAKELQVILDAALKPLTTTLEAQGKEIADIKKAGIDAGKAHETVKAHAEALRTLAAAMEAAGMGTDAQHGHAKVLNHMATQMEAEALTGRVPLAYRGQELFASAPAKKDEGGDNETVKKLEASIADLTTKLTDLSAKAFNSTQEPQRKTITPEIKSLLAKAGLTPDEKTGTLNVEDVDKSLAAAGIKGTAAMEAKLKLMASGHLPATNA